MSEGKKAKYGEGTFQGDILRFLRDNQGEPVKYLKMEDHLKSKKHDTLNRPYTRKQIEQLVVAGYVEASGLTPGDIFGIQKASYKITDIGLELIAEIDEAPSELEEEAESEEPIFSPVDDSS